MTLSRPKKPAISIPYRPEAICLQPWKVDQQVNRNCARGEIALIVFSNCDILSNRLYLSVIRHPSEQSSNLPSSVKIAFLAGPADPQAISLELFRISISFIYTSWTKLLLLMPPKRPPRRWKSPHKSAMMHKLVCKLTVIRSMIWIPCFRSCSGYLQ
jgi:hypothetical protein